MKGHKGKSKKASYFAGVESWKTKRHQKDDFYRKQVEEKELDDLPEKIIDVNKQIEEVFESWEELKAEEEQVKEDIEDDKSDYCIAVCVRHKCWGVINKKT